MANSIKLVPMNTAIRYGKQHYTYAHTQMMSAKNLKFKGKVLQHTG
jgi:hypothetical protein